ncbi:MAG: purine-binding chemotaxis protein CheW [Chrysiogenetes bacterium]|nr:purine-binding chemotaxis protein CheW [Chrysiogenetes bacterium]
MEALNEVNERPQYLSFFLGDEEYALEILRVKEIIEYKRVTKVPSTPRHVRGVINLRGSVIPVVDLGAKFGLDHTQVSKWTCIVITEVQLDDTERTVMGVMCDRVSDVIELAESDIEEVPEFGARIRVECLKGMGKIDGRLSMLLDIDQILSNDEIVALSELDESDLEKLEASSDEEEDEAEAAASEGVSEEASPA